MAFEVRILGTMHCPRCNGIAELRIDKHKTQNKWILVYIVCPICKLNKYSHTTTRKAVVLRRRINKMKSKIGRNPKRDGDLRNMVEKLEILAIRAEREF